MKTAATAFRLLAFTGAVALASLLAPVSSHAQTLFVSLQNAPAIDAFNIPTGAAASGFTSTSTGLNQTTDLTAGNNVLYAGNASGQHVSTYNASTGAVLNSSFISGFAVSGLTLAGTTLYVANASAGSVNTYTTTGTQISTLVTGLSSLAGLVVANNVLYVANNNTVNAYNATSGTLLTGFTAPSGLTGTYGVAVLGNNLFVSEFNNNRIGEYNATTGAVINANYITGLNRPQYMALSGNDLFVANYSGNTVGEYDATTGAAINAAFESVTNPSGIAVVPEPSTWIGGLVIVVLLGLTLRRRAARA